MKLMDEVAGIVAARHCNTNIVTASVDAINFHRKIQKGEDDGEASFRSMKGLLLEKRQRSDAAAEAASSLSMKLFFPLLSPSAR